MSFTQIATTDASLSYLFGCATAGKAVAEDVVAGDEQRFVDAANNAKARTSYVIDTHLHADDYSGGRKLIAAVGEVPPMPVQMERVLRINRGLAA